MTSIYDLEEIGVFIFLVSIAILCLSIAYRVVFS